MKRLLFFLLGVALGVGLAMLIGWVLFPMRHTAVTPASLRHDYRDEYVRLVALAYSVDGDLAQAEQRLQALEADDFRAPLVELTERWIYEGYSVDFVGPLVQLAYDLNAGTSAMASYAEGAGE